MWHNTELTQRGYELLWVGYEKQKFRVIFQAYYPFLLRVFVALLPISFRGHRVSVVEVVVMVVVNPQFLGRAYLTPMLLPLPEGVSTV